MEFLTRLGNSLADGRLGVHLIAAHGLITITVIAFIILRRLVTTGTNRLADSTGLSWVGAASEDAARRARLILNWLTVALLVVIVVTAVAYHSAGRDIREDLSSWLSNFTLGDLAGLGLRVLAIIATLFAGWIAPRLLRRVRPALEEQAATHLPFPSNREAVKHWFTLLEWYLIICVRVAELWLIGICVGLPHLAHRVCSFALEVISIIFVARLATLAFRIVSKVAADIGTRYLAESRYNLYWERVLRLFPFAERCFEAAVCVTVAWQTVLLLGLFISFVRVIGPGIVECIGIFFIARVLVELVHVLLHEAFGLSDESKPVDQKARTLVPLLCSVSQSALYFCAGLEVLQTLQLSHFVVPVLTGVGILGLAVGLGAQNLVTDVVSGFFILFENQYLVGDYVRIGDAAGVVEAVGIRVTEIRDVHGKLFIIPNGQIKGVVSYSKGFVNAVVDWKVPSGSNLEEVFRAMAEAGRRLKQTHREVLADTQIHGLVDFGSSDMTVRAVTKVKPGSHGAMQSEYRRLLKQVFDQNPSLTSPRAQAA